MGDVQIIESLIAVIEDPDERKAAYEEMVARAYQMGKPSSGLALLYLVVMMPAVEECF